MAMVLDKYEVVVSFMETSGKTVDRTYTAGPDITTLTLLETAWANALPKITAMSESEISSYVYKAIYIEDTIVLPTAAENQNEGYLTGKIIGDPRNSANVSVPAIKPGLMLGLTGPGYDIVDTSDAVVQAFVGLFDSSTVSGDWTISDGEAWDSQTVSGVRRTKKTTKGT